MNKQQQLVQEIIFAHLDKLYVEAVKASRHFEGAGVNRSVVKEIVKLSFLKNSPTLPWQFVEAFNKTLMVLSTTVDDHADHKGMVKKNVFKGFINVIKKSFNEGTNGAANN